MQIFLFFTFIKFVCETFKLELKCKTHDMSIYYYRSDEFIMVHRIQVLIHQLLNQNQHRDDEGKNILPFLNIF